MSISILGLYFYSTNIKVNNEVIPVTHIECIEETPFIFGESFSESF